MTSRMLQESVSWQKDAISWRFAEICRKLVAMSGMLSNAGESQDVSRLWWLAERCNRSDISGRLQKSDEGQNHCKKTGDLQNVA